jgi:hypothetical protein
MKEVTSVKVRNYATPISVVSLVLAMVLMLVGLGCSAAPSPASNTDASNMLVSTSLSVSEDQDNMPVGTSLSVGESQISAILDVDAIKARLETGFGHARWTEMRKVARYTERTVPEPWK